MYLPPYSAGIVVQPGISIKSIKKALYSLEEQSFWNFKFWYGVKIYHDYTEC